MNTAHVQASLLDAGKQLDIAQQKLTGNETQVTVALLATVEYLYTVVRALVQEATNGGNK